MKPLSVRKSIELCRIGDEDVLSRREVRRPRLKKFEQVPCVRHLALDARMRPVATPYQPLRVGIDERFMKRPGVGIVGRLKAQTMCARELHPAPAFACRAQQALE